MDSTADDQMAIQQVLYRYPYAVDERDWPAFARIFTPDVVCDMTAVGLGVTRSLETLVELFGEIEHPVAHHLVDPVIDPAPGGATVRSKWLVVLADRTTLSGRYDDELVRTDEGWRVRSRLITQRQEGSRRPVPGYGREAAVERPT